MDRYMIARMIAIFAVLGLFIPLLPGGRSDSLGFGAPYRTFKLNQRLSKVPADSGGRQGMTRLGGMQGLSRVHQLRQFAKTLQTEAKERPVTVQTRGISRNEMWIMAYDFYPVRVVGRFLDDGGRPDDPILPEADWMITPEGKRKAKLKLERAH